MGDNFTVLIRHREPQHAGLLDIALTELIPAGLVEDFDDYKDTLDVYLDGDDKNRLNFICHPNLVNQLRVLAGLIQYKL